MLRWNMIGVAGVAIAAAMSSATLVAGADPLAPAPDQSCAGNLVGAMTLPTGAKTPLVCTDGGWQSVTDPYPVSDRWLSYGPALTLHGEGRRNPLLESGEWVATPLDTETHCGATQLAVIPGSPTVGPPRVDTGDPGQSLALRVVPRLFSIEMSGDCLWQKSD